MAPLLSYVTIDVEFNPNASDEDYFTFLMGGDPLPTKTISVESGIAMIIFNLTTADVVPTKAVFQTAPVQWLRTGPSGERISEPVLVPDMFTLHRIGDLTITLIDFNSNQSTDPHDKNHYFNLVVLYDGKTYGSDPVIINEPPGQ